MYTLVHYVNERTQDEYVVIVIPGSDPHDFVEDGFSISNTVNIDGDASEFPTDRPLTS